MKKTALKANKAQALDMKKDALNGFTEGGRSDMKLDMLLKPKKGAKTKKPVMPMKTTAPTEKYAKNPIPFK